MMGTSGEMNTHNFLFIACFNMIISEIITRITEQIILRILVSLGIFNTFAQTKFVNNVPKANKIKIIAILF